MPLNTQVLRDGEPVKGLPWSGFLGETMLNIFLTVGLKEGDPELEYNEGKTFGELEPPDFVNVAWSGVYYIDTKASLWKEGKQTLSRDYTFEWGPEVEFRVELKKGDVLRMWRDYK